MMNGKQAFFEDRLPAFASAAELDLPLESPFTARLRPAGYDLIDCT